MDTLHAQQHDTQLSLPYEQQVLQNNNQEPVVTALPPTIRLIEDDNDHYEDGGYGEDEAYGEDEEYYDEVQQLQPQQLLQQQPYYRDDSNISFINENAIYETSRDSNMIRIVPRATAPTATAPTFVKVSETHTHEILPQLLQQSTPLQMAQQSPILSALPPIFAKPAKPASPITIIRSDVDEVIQEPAIPVIENIPRNPEIELKAEQEALNLVRQLSVQPSPPESIKAVSPVSPTKKKHEKHESIPHAPPADPVYSPIFQASPQTGLSPETSRKKKRALDKLKAILSLRRRSAMRHPPKKPEMMYNVVVLPDAPAATQEESHTIAQPLLFSSNLYTPAPTTSTTGVITAPATQEITVPANTASPLMQMHTFASPSQQHHLSPELDAIASTSITPLGISHLEAGDHKPSPVLTLQEDTVRTIPQPIASYTQVIDIAPDTTEMATRRPVPLEQFVDASACTPQFITSLNPNAELITNAPAMSSLVNGHTPLIDDEIREKLRRRKEVFITNNVTAENSEEFRERSGVKQFLSESRNKATLSELQSSKPELSLAQVQVLQVEKLEIKNLELSDELLRLLMRIIEMNKTSLANENVTVSPFVSPAAPSATEEGVFNSKEQYEKAKLLDYTQREKIELLKLKEKLELPGRESAAMQSDDPYLELLRREKERHIPGVFHEHLPEETHYKQIAQKQRNEHGRTSSSASSTGSKAPRSSERMADEISWAKELAIEKAAKRKLGAGKQPGQPAGDEDEYLSITSDSDESEEEDKNEDSEQEEGDEQQRDQREVIKKEEEQMLEDKLQREKLKRWQMKERRAFLEHHEPFEDTRGKAARRKRSRSHSPNVAPRPQREEDFFHNAKDNIKQYKRDVKKQSRKERRKWSEDDDSRVSASIRKYENKNAIMNVIRPLKRLGINHGPWIALLLAILIGWILVFTGRI